MWNPLNPSSRGLVSILADLCGRAKSLPQRMTSSLGSSARNVERRAIILQHLIDAPSTGQTSTEVGLVVEGDMDQGHQMALDLVALELE
jgi:hypothetical protein